MSGGTRYAAAMQRLRRWSVWMGLASTLACSDARLIDGFSEGQTRIRVVPTAFIGNVPCERDAAGALQHYVVQLQELGDGASADAGVTLSISPPVPCDRAVVFPAAASRFYAADILGFDVGEDQVGSSEPRWSASCGRGGGTTDADAGADPFAPTRAVRGTTVPLRGCTTFGDVTSTSSRLAVDVQSALGALRCGTERGEVAFVEGVLGSQRRRAACDQELVFDIASPGRFHSVALTGFELATDGGVAAPAEAGAPVTPPTETDAGDAADAAADAAALEAGAPPLPSSPDPDAGNDAGSMPAPSGGIPRWSTQCLGRSEPGITRVATCEPFEALQN